MSFKIADAWVDVEYRTGAAEESLRRAFTDRTQTVKVDADVKAAAVDLASPFLTVLQVDLIAVSDDAGPEAKRAATRPPLLFLVASTSPPRPERGRWARPG